MNAHDDTLLVERSLQGDDRAFGKIVDRYQGPVFHLAYSMARNVEDALDIAQSVFLKIYENLDSYDPQRPFFSWLYRIAMNESLNHCRKMKRHRQDHQDVDELDRRSRLVSTLAGPEEEYCSVELKQHLSDGIGKLSPDQQLVLLLRHFSGFSYAEIAEALQLPVKTVKSRLFSARQQLREILAKEGCLT